MLDSLLLNGFAIYHCHMRVLYTYLSQARKLHAETTITVVCTQEQHKLFLPTVSSPAGNEAFLRWVRTTELQGLLDHEGAHATCMSWKAGREDKRGLGEQKLSWRLHGQLHPNPSVKDIFCLHGQLPLAQTTPSPTLASPGVMVLSRSSWHQLFPAHIWRLLGVCVLTSQTLKIIYRKMPLRMLIFLYSNAAPQIQLDYGRGRSWTVIQSPSTTQEGNRIR